MYPTLAQIIQKISFDFISAERKLRLQTLIELIQKKRDEKQNVCLHFICTHNSRRSQFAQIWAAVAAHYYEKPIETYSGGMEVTALHDNVVTSLNRFGFRISETGIVNKMFSVEFSASLKPLVMYSKLVEDDVNPKSNFIAVMTCSDADQKCPIVSGCDGRVALSYDDPKYFDDSPIESVMYDYRSFEIATELFYVFSQLN